MTFDIAFDRLMGVEGGYVNDPNDPGGETNWGISKRSYPHVDIKNLTRDGAKAIYKTEFWDVIEADGLPGDLAFQVFDFSVNSGISTAIRYLQRALGVADDGKYGPVSRDTATRYMATPCGELKLIVQFLAERFDFWSRLSNWPSAGRGWTRRGAQDLRYGVADTP